MVLTTDILTKNGFYTNHPEKRLGSYKKANSSYFIGVESKYKSLSNELSFNVNCCTINNKGEITKESKLSDVKTVEELNDIIRITNIDFKLN